MTATAVREVGLPWFERHAIRGCKDIFAYAKAIPSEPGELVFWGAHWSCPDCPRAYYAGESGRTWHRLASEAPGFLYYRQFDTWDEAERWLMSKEEGEPT